MRTIRVALFVLSAVVLLAPRAFANCKASVSNVSINGSTLTATAEGGGHACGPTKLTLFLNGGVFGQKECSGECSITASTSVSCTPSTQPLVVSVQASCSKQVDGGGEPVCLIDQNGWSEAAPVFVNTTPTVTPLVEQPDPITGKGSLDVGYSFPNTEAPTIGNATRIIEVYLNNGFVARSTPQDLQDQSGTWRDIPLDLTCYPTGTYEVRVVARACSQNSSHPTLTTIETVPVSITRSVDLTPTYQQGANGNTKILVNYNFKNTGGPLDRVIWVWMNGSFLTRQEMAQPSGTLEIPIDTTCLSGPQTVLARAHCCGTRPGELVVDKYLQFEIDSKPSVFPSAGGRNTDGSSTITIGYDFKNTNHPAQRRVALVRDGREVQVWTDLPASGSVTTFAHGCGELLAVATACGRFSDPKYTDTAPLHLPEDGCKADRDSCDMPGRPVNYGSGDVSLDLPLFAIHQSPLPLAVALSYHSAAPLYPSLSREISPGWTHTFNQTLRYVDSNHLYGVDEEGRERFYSGGNGTWVSVRPADVHETVTRTGAELHLRDLSGTMRAFNALDGRWLSTTDRWGNSIRAGYDGSGNLTSVTDSVGRVVSITATGTKIRQLALPGGAVWILEYAGGNLSAIHDPVRAQPILVPSIIGSATPFNSDWAASYVLDENLNTDYASQALGANTYIDFDFGKSVRITEVTFTDRRSSGFANGTGGGGGCENVTAFDLIFSQDPTFGNGDDVRVPVSSPPCCDTVTTPIAGSGLTARYLRYDVTAVTGGCPNPGAAEFSFRGYDEAVGPPLVTTPSATAWRTFTYQPNALGVKRLLTSMRDEAGAIIEGHAYDASDRGITSFLESNRELVTLEYDTPSPGQTRVTHKIDDTKSQLSIFTLQYLGGRYRPLQIEGGCGTCGIVSDLETREYDPYGNVVRSVAADGRVTLQTFDANGRVLTRTEAAGTSAEHVTQYEYGHPGWPAFVTKTTEAARFGPRITTRTWASTAAGPESQLISSVSGKTSAGGPTVTLTTTTTFDARHRLLSVDGPRSVADVGSMTYHPDDDPNLNRRGRKASMTDAAGLTVSYPDYDVYGTAVTSVDANDVVTTTVPDVRGRTIQTIEEAVPGQPDESDDYVSARTFDGRDRVIESTDARGKKTRYQYESGTNLLLEHNLLDEQGRERERRHVTRNHIGSITREDLQSCDTPAPVCSSWTTLRSESYVYDSQNRRTQIVNADGTRRIYTYDGMGRVVNEQDENHTSPNITYTYDPAGRLATIARKLGSGTAVTSYAYDDEGNMVSMTDPNGNVTQFEYDDFDRRIKTISPVTGVSTQEYDEAGNIVRSTMANGTVWEMTWDAAQRMLVQTAARSGAATETITWTYDGSAPFARGRVSSMSDPSGSSTWKYDRRGLVKSERKTIGSATYDTAFGYDPNGNRTKIVYPSGRVVTYTFDHADRPYSAVSGATAIVSSASYMPFGPLRQLVFGNGTTQTMAYDSRYRISRNLLAGPAGTLADYEYGHDAAGNVSRIHDATNPAYNRDFAYDDLHRLTGANTGSALWGTGVYQYDAMGNLGSLTLGTTRNATFTHNGTTPRIASVTENGVTRAVTYDASGNEIAVGASAYEYSSRNKLSAAGGYRYEYDGRGLRTTTTADPPLQLAVPRLSFLGSMNPLIFRGFALMGGSR